MFYLIDATTKDVVEGGQEIAQQRPPWLGMHASQAFLSIWVSQLSIQAPLALLSNKSTIEHSTCAGVSVHLLNSIVAWLDIILSQPRSFSRRSQWLSIGLAVFYLHWILLCSHINGAFPYPFLNKLPQPQVSPLTPSA